jgi:hypothetical protein
LRGRRRIILFGASKSVLKVEELRKNNLRNAFRLHVAHANRPAASGPGEGHADGEWGNHGGPSRSPDKEEWFMKIRIVGLLAATSLILAFAFLVSTHAAPNKANTPATPTASALPATPAAATPAEPHPEIREALEALRRAKGHLEHAAHDFGGHRVEAIEATNQAIKQLEICLKFDKD